MCLIIMESCTFNTCKKKTKQFLCPPLRMRFGPQYHFLLIQTTMRQIWIFRFLLNRLHLRVNVTQARRDMKCKAKRPEASDRFKDVYYIGLISRIPFRLMSHGQCNMGNSRKKNVGMNAKKSITIYHQ